MIFRRRQRQEAPAPRQGYLAQARRLTIPIIGAVTPIGLIVVNVAAFIVHHLTEFRWTITVLAFVSSIMLNSWVGLNIHRVIAQRRPDHPLVQERNQEVVLVGGLGVVIVIAFLTALFCYLGLSSEADLPNGVTFITGAAAILLPFAAQAAFRQATRRRRPDRTQAPYTPGVPERQPPGPPLPPPVGDTANRR